ncbi:hypothetical protein PsAD2_04347 [Pseudovibrio axinellae]|uniref:DUF4440 domain-containing protein n=1 Tax=Pseudovibrio axinellae TaxID=989403 RepID=A0A165T4P5_9HYPH|nr:nuclear transport factor 2 family protein [Pseudovibrio axinellae]KZL05422.1 hypothetical protein PsAD2_04347 [Pseudovibrio axinellae]SEP99925.1 protein of unknown function [Pseudovibrio axinellae]
MHIFLFAVARSLIFCMGALVISAASVLAGEVTDFSEHLKEQDNQLFSIGFNTCDIDVFDRLVSDDFEFFHDQGGVLYTKEAFIASVKTGICSLDYRAERQLVEDSIEVYPLYQDGEIYGAIQRGAHVFLAHHTNGTVKITSKALFTHLWRLEGESWKLHRVLSFAHESPET